MCHQCNLINIHELSCTMSQTAGQLILDVGFEVFYVMSKSGQMKDLQQLKIDDILNADPA